MPTADVILKNANVVTVDPFKPRAGLVAVKGRHIIFVGGEDDLDLLTGPGTKAIDCGGKTLMPGFVDAHCHIFSFIRKQLTVDLGPQSVRSIEDIKSLISKKAKETPRGQWIAASDYSDFYLLEKRHPNRGDLDQVAPDHPVILSHRSLHACVLNSRALELAGIRMDTPEPPGGSIHRDANTGEPDGVLFDMLGHIRYNVMPPLSGTELDHGISAAGREFLSLGITSLQDATVTNEVKRWGIYRRAHQDGLLKSRVYLMTGVDRLKSFREEGIGFLAGDDRLRMGGVKIVLGEATGRIYPSQPDLNEYVLEANRSGYQIAIHAVQPRTVEAAITALEYARERLPRPDLRHRLEHCAECPQDLFNRVVKLGALISTQPPFLHYSGDRYLAEIPPDQIPYLYRIRSFLDAGLVVSGSSDTPVVPNDPLMGIYSAVERRTATGRLISPQERISARDAVCLYTLNAAYASFDEGDKGSITPGKLADLVLLSDDPTQVEPGQIKDIKVLKTVIDGDVVWER